MVTTRSNRKKQPQLPSTIPDRERGKWSIIYKALKQLLRKLNSQLDSSRLHSHFLQKQLDFQHRAWETDVFQLQFHLSELRKQLEFSQLANSVEVAKIELLLGSNQRDAFDSKFKLEDCRRELDDLKAWFDILSHRCPPDHQDVAPDWLYEVLRTKGGKSNSPDSASEEQCKMLKKEIATLKREYEKLSVKNSSEVSSLRTEIKFAWNQYNEKEGIFTNQLQAKKDEVEKANEKITTLLARLEQLQWSNSEKDQIVSTLRATINRMEDEAHQKDEMISRSSKELGQLKSKRPIVGPPTLKRCSAEPSSSRLERLKSSSSEKDQLVSTLRATISRMEDEACQKDEIIARSSKELELLMRPILGSPALKQCLTEASPSSSKRKKSRRDKESPDLEEGPSSAQVDAGTESLRFKRIKLEVEANLKNGEIARLSKELNLLRSKTVGNTPISSHSTSEPSFSRLRNQRNGSSRGAGVPKEEVPSAQLVSEKGGKSGKRKLDDVIVIEETPRLFTSQFKIPKLKSQSPRGR